MSLYRFKKVVNHSTPNSFFETLWQSGPLEESFIACYWSEAIHKQYSAEDYHIFERCHALHYDTPSRKCRLIYTK